MSFSYVFCAQPFFTIGQIVKVEVDITKGMYQFNIVGMASKSVDEARDRVSSAIKNSSFQAIKSRHEKITISLSPAELKKSGAFYDLAIAMAYLSALGELKIVPEGKLFIGELSLDGKLLAVTGILPMLIFAKENGYTDIYIPEKNISEALLVHDIRIYPVKNLLELAEHFKNIKVIKPKIATYKDLALNFPTPESNETSRKNDISRIKGHDFAKRGLLIAATGKHHICLYGPPGTGKTMLAKSLPSILPNLEYQEIIEVNSIHSVVGIKKDSLIINPPLRNPHHSASYSAIVGGGIKLRPGEISLAHHGILFLDEFPEFDRRVIESLRQPLEDGFINISRAEGSISFPSRFILVATMNPCPCGYYGSSVKNCSCTPHQIQQYRKKISGPIADRIDIWIHVNNINYQDLQANVNEKHKGNRVASEIFLEKNIKAREFRKNRELPIGTGEFGDSIHDPRLKKIFIEIADRLNLSPRSYYKLLGVARTIADLELSEHILEPHILEAVQYRKQDL